MNFIKRLRLLAVVFVGSVVGCGEGGPPKLVVDSQVLDFGVLPRGGKNLEIPITNQGTATLKILDVFTSCACTLAQNPKAIPPGQTRMLVLTPPKYGPGPHSSRVLVKSNDPAMLHEFYLTWFGESPPRLDPPKIVEHNVPAGTTFQREVKIAYAGGDARYGLEVKNIETSAPSIEAQFLTSNVTAKHSSFVYANFKDVVGETKFQLRCLVPQTTGVVVGECKFTVVQAGQEHHLTLPIELHVVGAIAYSGPAFFSASRPAEIVGKKRTVVLRLRDAGAQPVVLSAPDLVKPTITQMDGRESNHPQYRLHLEVVKEPPPGNYRGAILVQLGEKKESQVSIPLQIVTFP